MQRYEIGSWCFSFLFSGVWVGVRFFVLVSLSEILYHYCYELWLGRKAVCPVCCVMYNKGTMLHLLQMQWLLNVP